jgi:hypothetical protein
LRLPRTPTRHPDQRSALDLWHICSAGSFSQTTPFLQTQAPRDMGRGRGMGRDTDGDGDMDRDGKGERYIQRQSLEPLE